MSFTPEQFDKLVTKDYLNACLEDEIGSLRRDILSAIDGLAKSVENAQSEQTANIAAHDRIQEDVSNLDLRVKKLEGIGI